MPRPKTPYNFILFVRGSAFLLFLVRAPHYGRRVTALEEGVLTQGVSDCFLQSV